MDKFDEELWMSQICCKIREEEREKEHEKDLTFFPFKVFFYIIIFILSVITIMYFI